MPELALEGIQIRRAYLAFFLQTGQPEKNPLKRISVVVGESGAQSADKSETSLLRILAAIPR